MCAWRLPKNSVHPNDHWSYEKPNTQKIIPKNSTKLAVSPTVLWRFDGVFGYHPHEHIWSKKLIWGFPKIVVPQYGWFIMENPHTYNGNCCKQPRTFSHWEKGMAFFLRSEKNLGLEPHGNSQEFFWNAHSVNPKDAPFGGGSWPNLISKPKVMIDWITCSIPSDYFCWSISRSTF